MLVNEIVINIIIKTHIFYFWIAHSSKANDSWPSCFDHTHHTHPTFSAVKRGESLEAPTGGLMWKIIRKVCK